jgi:hypothetical protein
MFLCVTNNELMALIYIETDETTSNFQSYRSAHTLADRHNAGIVTVCFYPPLDNARQRNFQFCLSVHISGA